VAGAIAGGSAGVAHADPAGCVGVSSIPEAFVCVVSVTPTNAVPTVGTTGGTPVTVPSVCYFLSCTDPTTVVVPVVTGGTGSVAVIFYNGSTYVVPNPMDTAAVLPFVYQVLGTTPAVVVGQALVAIGDAACQLGHAEANYSNDGMPRYCGGFNAISDPTQAPAVIANPLYNMAWQLFGQH
jgi:hypothetical protein